MKYLQRLEELKLTNQKHLPDLGDDSIEKIMYKIKCRVMKERMRLSEFFKDYDKLRTGRILKTVFPRAMDLASLKLTKVEVEQLMNRYVWGRKRLVLLLFQALHTGAEKYENKALFLRLGLPSTLIRHENAAFRKRSSNGGICVDGKHFDGTFRNNDISIDMWFPRLNSPQTQI